MSWKRIGENRQIVRAHFSRYFSRWKFTPRIFISFFLLNMRHSALAVRIFLCRRRHIKQSNADFDAQTLWNICIFYLSLAVKSIRFDLVIGIRFCHLIRIPIGGKRLTTRKIVVEPKTAKCRLIAFPFGSLNTKRKHNSTDTIGTKATRITLKKDTTEQKSLTHSAVTWVKHQTKWFNLNFQCCHLNRRFAFFPWQNTRQTHIRIYSSLRSASYAYFIW